MSGRESLKGFRFQIYVMLLSFLEHCMIGSDFRIVGEPAKNIDRGDIVDIEILFNSDGRPNRKLIQVKKTINTNITREVINEFIKLQLNYEEPVELWFTEYVLGNKMKLIDTLDKLKQAISIPGFARNEIQGKFGEAEILISVDNTVNSFILDGKILKLSAIDTLDGENKEQIEDEINLKFKIKKQLVISKIKHYLNDTLEYKRYKFIENLDPDPEIRQNLFEKEYSFFNQFVIRQISDRELHNEIFRILPTQLNQNQKAILKDVLYSHFYFSSSESQYVNKKDAERIMIDTIREFGHNCNRIVWDKKDIHGQSYSDIDRVVPEGDYSIGGPQV